MKKINVATVFSGIGAIEFALKRLNIEHNIVFACDNGERDITYNKDEEYKKVISLKTPIEKKKYVDELYKSRTKSKNYVKESYIANYKDFDEDFYFQDIMLLDGTDFKGKVDLFVGGSPCQSFSSVGFQHGLDDARGTLFYEYARLIKEIEPEVFIYENVRNLITHDHGNTWKVIKGIFDSLGYHYKFEILNAADYGVPQTRRRLFVVGFKKENNFVFPPNKKELDFEMKDFLIDNCSLGNFNNNNNDGNITIENVCGEVDSKYILSSKIHKYVMCTGTKTFHQKVQINMKIARTILKTMGNRHRAGVDNYFSNDGSEDLGKVRMLTEREAHRLMGFTDDYDIVVSRAQAYKQAGNSIVVDVMIAILQSIVNTNIFD